MATGVVVEIKNNEEGKAIVEAKGLTFFDNEEVMNVLNGRFEDTLLFSPNEGDVIEIRSTSPSHTAVDIAAELEDMGFLWKNPQNLGVQTAKCSPRHLQYLKSLSRKANATVRAQ